MKPPPGERIIVQRVLEVSGVSRRVFYEQFPGGLTECFARLALLARGLQAKRRELDETAMAA